MTRPREHEDDWLRLHDWENHASGYRARKDPAPARWQAIFAWLKRLLWRTGGRAA